MLIKAISAGQRRDSFYDDGAEETADRVLSAGEAGPAPRLSLAALPNLLPGVRLPRFDVAALRPGIVHLGCGAFHRAHQAMLTQHALEAESKAGHARGHPPPAWGIVSVSLRTPGVAISLRRQQGLYTVLERGPVDTRPEVIGSLTEVLFAPEQRQRLAALMADAAIRIVSLTVTTEGYCLDGDSGRLDPAHPDILADLQAAQAPRSAIGVLVAGLAARRAAGIRPPVVLSCDNLAGNGRLLRQACIDFAALRNDDRLAAWIAAQVQFPCSMVDRIVPVPTPSDHDDASRLIGTNDTAALSAEPFCQWVIERFDGPHPAWHAAGAEFVSDVGPWEASKLRLLNGGHLALAYLGLLSGARTVAQAIERPGMVAYLLRFLLDEQRPTLPPSDHDLSDYAHRLVDRWRNHGIAHQLERIVRDGSAKLPARLLAPLRDNLRAGRPVPCTLLALVAWMSCTSGRDCAGRPLGVALIDARASGSPPPAECGRHAGADAALAFVDSFLCRRDVVGDDLPGWPRLREDLARTLLRLWQVGVEGAIAGCLAGEPS